MTRVPLMMKSAAQILIFLNFLLLSQETTGWLWFFVNGGGGVVLLHASVSHAQILEVAPSAGLCKHISLSYY